MAGMILMPTEAGIKELQEHTKDALEKVQLLDKNKKVVYEAEIFIAFYDANKILTAQFDIPTGVNLTATIYYVNVVAKGKVIAKGSLPTPIAFVEGVGGIQTLKFPVTGDELKVIFKNNNFLTVEEVDNFYLLRVFESISSLRLSCLKAELKEIETEKSIKSYVENLKRSFDETKENMIKEQERMWAKLFSLVLQNQKAILQNELSNL